MMMSNEVHNIPMDECDSHGSEQTIGVGNVSGDAFESFLKSIESIINDE